MEFNEVYDLPYGLEMPYMPSEGYASMQNPPNFTWKNDKDAVSYDIKVCTDKALERVMYSMEGVHNNYYNFDRVFDCENTYFWSVRANYADGTVGEWSPAISFRIRKDAHPFPVAPIDELLKRIPASHPRVLVTPDTLEEFRGYKDKNPGAKKIYDHFVTRAEEYVSQYKEGKIDFEETVFYTEFGPEYAEWGMYLQKFRWESLTLSGICDVCAYAYLMTGRKEFAEVAKKGLLAMSEWCGKRDENGNIIYDENGKMMYDPDGHTSYKNQDQVHRQLAYRSAMAYDWIYDTLSQEEKEKILNMLDIRTSVMDYLMGALSRDPYDSHGWTAFGYIGIIAIATYGENSKADMYLKEIIPAYTAILPPWSYQDGGWSQGTDYWQYSTFFAQEFMDVLARAGVLNLYDEAWARNEYLWSLYAYPAGSYGSFGDQSNRMFPGANKREPFSASTLMNHAYYSNNPYALWLAREIGTEFDTMFDSYFTEAASVEAKSPSDHPLAHWFKDIDWVVMTDSLEDRERVQMTFKSSPYGSFNHSHPDQNAFIIQAYGENLALKSGYYDAYHTIHDSTITRATFSHNTITVDGAKGQSDDNFQAKGKILSFANCEDFASVTGDATSAYNNVRVGYFTKTPEALQGELDKFTRTMLYLRPDVFITVDKLKAKDKSSFEWWLNSEHKMEYSDNEAYIKEGKACLDAKILYPENVKAKYYEGFVSPIDDKHYPATGRCLGWNEQDKICFYTENVDKTAIVSLMNVHKDGEAPKEYTVYKNDKVMKLTFETATVYINLTEKAVSSDNITFDGDAVVISQDGYMLANGTFLDANGKQVIKSTEKTTCIVSGGGLSFASDSKACKIEINKEYFDIESKEEVCDVFGNSIDLKGGAEITVKEGVVEVTAQKGYYEWIIK